MGTFQIPQEDPDWIYYTPKERGGLNLDPELAGNLQNQLREWICTRLNE